MLARTHGLRLQTPSAICEIVSHALARSRRTRAKCQSCCALSLHKKCNAGGAETRGACACAVFGRYMFIMLQFNGVCVCVVSVWERVETVCMLKWGHVSKYNWFHSMNEMIKILKHMWKTYSKHVYMEVSLYVYEWCSLFQFNRSYTTSIIHLSLDQTTRVSSKLIPNQYPHTYRMQLWHTYYTITASISTLGAHKGQRESERKTEKQHILIPITCKWDNSQHPK